MRTAPAKARRNRLAALATVATIGGFVLLFGALRAQEPVYFWAGWLPAVLVVGSLAYLAMTRKFRRRARLARRPIPAAWRQILRARVAFYNALPEPERRRFEEEVAIFLAEKRITGVKTLVDDETRVLVATSAVIPIFGFPEWEYDRLAEVLVYPSSFDDELSFDSDTRKNILGMVGVSGALNRIMILSKPDLVRGFSLPADKRNVGVHEFAHVVDGADGEFDGIPATIAPESVAPWLRLMRLEMERINNGDSILRRYGATNEAEFFAVATEAFFERPTALAERHPELYALLEQIFQQDTRSIFTSTVRSMLLPYPVKIRRNAPCPCGSRQKYKRCCLHQR
jgi:Mlc titration factor MtfA (ptsG expression regulator)